jgi:hypothetical protein
LISDPKYRAIFPHVRFTEATRKISLPHGGTRSAFTLTGSITGSGADMVIIDDPQAAHEADEKATSESVKNWYDRNIYQRLDDKNDGVVILLMQRLAKDDLTAHLLARGGWEHIILPAIATEEEHFPGLFGGRIVRKKGEALNPARENRDQLRAAMVQMGARAFMAQYQQSPYPTEEGHGCGVFHIIPRPDATEEECKGAMILFGHVPEETFLLETLFGEFSGIRRGPPPELTTEEWIELHRGTTRQAYGLNLP